MPLALRKYYPVWRFVERAAEAGAVKLAQKAGLGYEDARAELRTRFRRRLSVGGWRDFYAHLCARIPYINPSPAAEAKLLAQRREVDYRWAQKRAAVHQRRLGEGEAQAHRAGSGRGMAMSSRDNEKGSAAATQATEFLEALMQDKNGGGNGGERRGPAQDADMAANQRPDEAAVTESPKTDKQATPAMAIESCSGCETSEREREPERHRIAFREPRETASECERLIMPGPRAGGPTGAR